MFDLTVVVVLYQQYLQSKDVSETELFWGQKKENCHLLDRMRRVNELISCKYGFCLQCVEKKVVGHQL